MEGGVKCERMFRNPSPGPFPKRGGVLTSLQRTAAAILVSRSILARGAAAVAEVWRL